MKCLVTGATGFVGSHLVRWLVQQGCHIAILVRPKSILWRLQDVAQYLHVIGGDLFDVEKSASSVREFAPEVVFHLGWSSVSVRYRDDPLQIQNLWGSLNLVQIARDGGCRHWIGLGSQAEYGRYDSTISEDSPTRPTTLYGITKLSTALLSQRLCDLYGIHFVWLRLFATYGPMDNPTSLIPYVIRTLLDKGKPLLTSGEQRWDYLFIADVVRAIWQTVISPHARGIFNLGSGEAVAVRRIVEQVRDLINPQLSLEFGKKPYDAGQSMLLEADVSRLHDATGWSPTVSLSDGLRQTVEWYRNQWAKEHTSESL